MAKSIMQEEDGTCYLCVLLHGDDSRKNYREEHHVFGGTANRKLSEKYGLKVKLCYPHHNMPNGTEAVHFNKRIRQILQEEGRKAFLRNHTEEEFREIFGKSFAGEDSGEQEWDSIGEDAGADREGTGGASGECREDTGDAAADFRIIVDGVEDTGDAAAGFRIIADGVDGIDWQ